jgi:hypothetical protein
MMTSFGRVVALSAALAVAPTVAMPNEDPALEEPFDEASEAAPLAVSPAYPAPAQPPTAMPTDDQAPPAQQGSAQGQWVHTQQYGWVWMPYGDAYTYLPPDGGDPNMYVYYPTIGWCWVIAPWLWGWGPMPYFGHWGWSRFGWFGHGYGHWYGFRGQQAGWYGRGYFQGGRWNGYRAGSPVRPRPPLTPHGAAPWSGRGSLRSDGGFPSRGGLAPGRPGHFAMPRGAPPIGQHGGLVGRGGHSGGGHSGSGRGDRGHSGCARR